MSKHKSGPVNEDTPWRAEGLKVYSASDVEVATVSRDPDIEDYREQRAHGEARARRIAAAPEMLNALIGNVDMLHRIKRELANPMPEVEHALNVALAAIAKAEGRDK